MNAPSFLQEAVEALDQAKDPATTVRDLILQSGGRWSDALAQEKQAAFEIHLFGIAGVGFGAEGAVQSWLEAARQHLSEQASSKVIGVETQLSA